MPTESFLILSDVHLGSDLNDSGPVVPRSKAIDADLAACLNHYASTAPSADRWHLVLAGDFVDFVGMAIDPAAGDAVANASERKYGMFGAETHVREKVRRAVARHDDVFVALRRLVEGGNAVTFVSGNHDTEMHWPAVQEDLRAAIGGTAGNVRFEPWLFFKRGLLFVEHGHQYDPFCASPFIMTPVLPHDPGRVAPSLSDTLLRYVVRRTPGMREYGHEDRGLWSYISWGLMLGARGTLALFGRFIEVVRDLRHAARGYETSAASALETEQRTRLAALAERVGVSVADLDVALAMHARSLGSSPRLVLASVMLDRLLTFCAMVLAFTVLAIVWRHLGGYGPAIVAALLLVWTVLHISFSRARPSVDPAAEMVKRAGELAAVFPCAFVVMGHTHVPTSALLANATYLNTGSWAEEEPDPAFDLAKAYRAARTHLVIHERTDGRHEAQLRAWRAGAPEILATHVAVAPPVAATLPALAT